MNKIVKIKVLFTGYPTGKAEEHTGIFNIPDDVQLDSGNVSDYTNVETIVSSEHIQLPIWDYELISCKDTKKSVTDSYSYVKDLKVESIEDILKGTIKAQKDIIKAHESRIESLQSINRNQSVIDIVHFIKLCENDSDLQYIYNVAYNEVFKREHDLTQEEYEHYIELNKNSMWKISTESAKISYATQYSPDKVDEVEKEYQKKVEEVKHKYKELLEEQDHKLNVKVLDKTISYSSLVSYISHLYWGGSQQTSGLLNYENERVRKHTVLCKQLGIDRTHDRETDLFYELERIISYSNDALNASEACANLKSILAKKKLLIKV
jgi:hypothetical protein